MNSTLLKRIDEFTKRHLILSSFLCLLILATALQFFGNYTGTIHSTLYGEMEYFIISAKWSIYGIWIWIVPVFLISLILRFFLKKKDYHNNRLSFPRKFILSFITTLAIIIFILIGIIKDIPKPYARDPVYLYALAFFTSCFCSAVFGAFFGWQSRASGKRIIVQSIIVIILMNIYLLFIYAVNQISL